MAELEFKEKMDKAENSKIILAIESSCDETAVAVLSGNKLLSNEISSQIEIHKRFGGVVPEVASRNHLLAAIPLVDSALKKAGVDKSQIDAVAVTYGAGLIGALLVGVSVAKALAYALGVPLIKVNHIEGHIAANYIEHPDLKPPFLAIVASGGHTCVVDASSYTDYRLLTSTTDDAIGEAFDKVARVLNLGYPGGPAIDKLAESGKPDIQFMQNKAHSLSYSGLKTAVINYLHTHELRREPINLPDVCASFQKTAVDMLVNAATAKAIELNCKTVVLAGGVAANSYLRQAISQSGRDHGFNTYYPSPILCTDNAAMIAMRAYHSLLFNQDIAGLDLNADSSLRLKTVD